MELKIVGIFLKKFIRINFIIHKKKAKIILKKMNKIKNFKIWIYQIKIIKIRKQLIYKIYFILSRLGCSRKKRWLNSIFKLNKIFQTILITCLRKIESISIKRFSNNLKIVCTYLKQTWSTKLLYHSSIHICISST